MNKDAQISRANSSDPENKLSWGTRLGYGVGSMGDACTYTLIGTFLMFFLTTVVGINPVTAGTIAAVGAVWDATCSPVIGFLSDNVRSKYGRRLPFVFFAAFPLGISCALLFNGINADETVKILYYGVMVLMFWTSFSFFFVPYMALGAEITGDYNERTLLRSVAYGFSIVGMVVGMVAPTLIVDLLQSKSFTLQQAWSITGILIGSIAIVAVMISCFSLKSTIKKNNVTQMSETKSKMMDEDGNLLKLSESENVHEAAKKSIFDILKEYWQVLRIKPTKFVLFASISYLVANTMNYSDRIYFMTYILKLDPKTITFAMFTAIASGALFIPLITRASARFDKRTVYITCMGVGGLCTIASRFIGISGLPGMMLFLFLFACANSAYWQLVPAMIYDVCEVDEAVNCKRREGSVISLQALSESVASAISMQLLGIILGASGFVGADTVQSPLTDFWIENSFSLIPGIFMGISAFMIYKYPITKQRFQVVLSELEKRKNGGEVDLEEIKDLI